MLTISFTQLGQITPVIVFEIACHHLIETFSSVFSQGTTYLVMIVLRHGSIPPVTILPGMTPRDDLKFSFFPNWQSIRQPQAQAGPGLSSTTTTLFWVHHKNNNDDLRTVGKRGVNEQEL